MVDDGWLLRAAAGWLPVWANASSTRQEHMARVARVMEDWAIRSGLDHQDRLRWTAAGWLHDALRDAPPEHMEPWVMPPFEQLDSSLWHGPATAERLTAEGVEEPALLDAIRYHTLGHPGLEAVGRALIAADFLEPGRPGHQDWRASLRKRAPGAMDEIVLEVLKAKIDRALGKRQPVRPETIAMWNELTARRTR
ncbi:MAG: HD domain-containing protein [Longimicrobiales bacterium]